VPRFRRRFGVMIRTVAPDRAIILSQSLLRMIDGAQVGPGGAPQSMDVFMHACNQRLYFAQNEKEIPKSMQ
jgi:hypothetical protein